MKSEERFKWLFIISVVAVELSIFIFILIAFNRYMVSIHHGIYKEYEQTYTNEQKKLIKNVVLDFVEAIDKDNNNLSSNILKTLKNNVNQMYQEYVSIYKNNKLSRQLFTNLLQAHSYTELTLLDADFKVLETTSSELKKSDKLLKLKKLMNNKDIFSGIVNLNVCNRCFVYAERLPNGWILAGVKSYQEALTELQNTFKQKLENFRYRADKTGYIFVLKLERDNGIIKEKGIVLPNERSFEGKYIPYKTIKDIKGNYFTKHMTDIALTKGNGYIVYYKRILGSNTISKKTSFIYYYKPWRWIIGSGFYPDIFSERLNKKDKILTALLNKISLKLALEVLTFELLLLIIIFFFIKDMTSRLTRYRKELLKRENFQKHLIESIPNPLIVLNDKCDVINTNKAFEDFFCKEDIGNLTERIKKYHSGTDILNYMEFEIGICKKQKFIGINCSEFNDNNEKIIISIIFDLTDKKQTQDRLTYLSTVDELTQLYNRRHFNKVFYEETERAKQLDKPISLIIFDIDHFKKINDTYGHDTGDTVLRQLSKLIKDNVRSMDMVFRIGGEEFAILLVGTPKEMAYSLAEKLRTIVQNFTFDDVKTLTISLGVASLDDAMTPEDLFKQADKALYSAKESGRNQTKLS